jgi:hypothetical protein
MAHLLVKRGSALMLTTPAWHHAQAAQHHALLLPTQQRRQNISAISVDLFDRLY